MEHDESLKDRVVGDETVVAVVGQGYVGLTVGAAAAVAGMTVRAIDVVDERISYLAAGTNPVAGVEEGLYERAFASGRMTFTTDFSAVADADVVLLCVPTPLVEHRPDLSFIESACQQVAPHLSRGSLVVLESTTYAGTTEQVVQPLLEAGGLECGRDFALAYSPERVDPGNTRFGFRQTPRIVGSADAVAGEAAAAFYRRIVDEVHVLSSARAAELAKLLENTFRMVNIALVNELAMLCADQDISIWEVVGAAATKPFGFMPFYPGPGVGGHCIPLDPTYLSWQAYRDTGRRLHLVETAQDVNDQMPVYVASRVVEAINEHGLSVKGANIRALGVTYKPDVGDVRESAAVEVLGRLAQRRAAISFHDPFIEHIELGGLRIDRTELSYERLADADCVLLLTPHRSYDLDAVVKHSRLVFDARNAIDARGFSHVVTL